MRDILSANEQLSSHTRLKELENFSCSIYFGLCLYNIYKLLFSLDLYSVKKTFFHIQYFAKQY